MKKVCLGCNEIYEDYIQEEYCPKVECRIFDLPLVELDDMMVDLIIQFNNVELETIGCCAGHIYDNCMSSYIVFFANQFSEKEHEDINTYNFEALKEAHSIFTKLNSDNKFAISEIETTNTKAGYLERDGFKFRVGSRCKLDMDSSEKLDVQYYFLKYMYEVVSLLKKEYEEESIDENITN
jgi:hypothetical protein